jgi:hypothetical protein
MQTKIHLVTRILVPEKPRVMRKPRNAGTRCMYIVVAVGLSGILKAKQKLGVTFNFNKQDVKWHSVEEVLERATGYPKVAGSNHSSGDFSLQPQWNPYPTLTPPSC